MTISGPPETRAEPDGAGWVLIVCRGFAQTPEQVWAALTEVDQMTIWGPFTADRDLTSPGPVRLTQLDVAEPRVWDSLVHTAVRPWLLVVDWEGGTLRWELRDDGGGTRLTLRHRFLDAPWAPSFAAGWHLCLDALAAALNGDPMLSVVGDSACLHGWRDLHDRYSQTLMGSGWEAPR